jgi:hypothetical protein
LTDYIKKYHISIDLSKIESITLKIYPELISGNTGEYHDGVVAL